MARHHRTHRHKRHSRRNILNKTVDKSVSIVKNTSKKYMPKVKTGLESVGSKVISSSKKSIPFLQRMTRKLFGSKRRSRR
jgi:hypothetical protein